MDGARERLVGLDLALRRGRRRGRRRRCGRCGRCVRRWIWLRIIEFFFVVVGAQQALEPPRVLLRHALFGHRVLSLKFSVLESVLVSQPW